MTCENFEIGRRQPSSERYTPDALLVAHIEEMIDSVAPMQGMSFDALCPVTRNRQIVVTDEYARIYQYSYPDFEYRVVRGLSVPVVLAAPERISDTMRITSLNGRSPGIEISAYSEQIGEHKIRIKKTATSIQPEMGFTDYPGFMMEYCMPGAGLAGDSEDRILAGRFAAVDEYGLIDGPLKKKPSFAALVVLVDVIGRKDHAGFSSGRVEFTGLAIAEKPRSYRKSLLIHLEEYQKHHSLPVEYIRKAEEMLWRKSPDYERRGRMDTLVAAIMEPEIDTSVDESGDVVDVPIEALAQDLHLKEEDIHPEESAAPVVIPHARKMFLQTLQAIGARQEVGVTG